MVPFGYGEPTGAPVEVGSVLIPTPYGEFHTHVFETATGHVYLALTKGDITGGESVLTRLHSECLTGDALGSLRCDCGVQLRTAMRAVSAEARGVVLYLTDQEGRGIGLLNKLRAYMEQDVGADTLEANLRLGLPPDRRDYTDAAAVLEALGVRSVRLLSNNPAKADALRQLGVRVAAVEPLATVAHRHNLRYLTTKADRLGHVRPAGTALTTAVPTAVDVGVLLGQIRPHNDRPYVLVKYAQTLDGRIATRTGDSKWISGEAERRISHALRAACDAVLVGSGTVRQDNPELTVRLVPGVNPIRVVLDSTLRTVLTAKVAGDLATTVVFTTSAADPTRKEQLRAAGVTVHEVTAEPQGVNLTAVLSQLRGSGVESLMVEGGRRVITSLFAAGLVDRLVVSISPTVIGTGVEAVGDLGIGLVAEGVRLTNRAVCLADDDVLLGWDVEPRTQSPATVD
ncbi:MAG TPA: GTP cyclohydrolase II [Actinomycetes bacterium]|nr:GTP cyclohydrolase II [Actinomycetes bacterium]